MKASTYKRFKALEEMIATLDTKLVAIAEQLTQFIEKEIAMAHDITEVLQNLDDIQGLATQLLEVISKSDAEKQALQDQITTLIAASTASQAAKDALQVQIDAAFDKSAAAENTLRGPVPGVPPVGGTVLGVTYADKASFDAAVASYTGPEAVTLDGAATAKTGTTPSLDYFTHSADGHIDTAGPTD